MRRSGVTCTGVGIWCWERLYSPRTAYLPGEYEAYPTNEVYARNEPTKTIRPWIRLAIMALQAA